jgi:hypothetical protein
MSRVLERHQLRTTYHSTGRTKLYSAVITVTSGLVGGAADVQATPKQQFPCVG